MARRPSSAVNSVIKIINNTKETLKVTLSDVNIDASKKGDAAVSVTGSGDTTIELDGDNVLKSSSGHAGLEHNQTSDSSGNITSGTLTVQDEKTMMGLIKPGPTLTPLAV